MKFFLLRRVTTDQSRYSLNGFEGKIIQTSHCYHNKQNNDPNYQTHRPDANSEYKLNENSR